MIILQHVFSAAFYLIYRSGMSISIFFLVLKKNRRANLIKNKLGKKVNVNIYFFMYG